MIESFIKKYKLPSFRLTQFNNHFYKEAVTSFRHFSSWPKELRDTISKELSFSSIEVKKNIKSKTSNVIKVLFARKSDGKQFESVLIQHEDYRNTVCVSSMIGCPVGCVFCASGRMGFGGNLRSEEIIDQILYFKRLLNTKNMPITNVVFMGMGEPLLNLDNVLEAVEILKDPDKLGLSARRVTLSTSGYVPELHKLMESNFHGRLAISLHAPNQRLREYLMPKVAKLYPLKVLFKALSEYEKFTNKRITYEYLLIDGVNDKAEHALELVKLLKGRLAHVNLIPFNPIRGLDFKPSTKTATREFTAILKGNEINYTFRITMGTDVNAACGQLAAKRG